jgi:hypothetical protein
MTAAILMLSVTLANCSQTLVPKSIIDIDSFIQSAAGEVCDECKDKAEDYAKKFDELKKHMKDLEKINKQVRKLQKEVDKTIKKIVKISTPPRRVSIDKVLKLEEILRLQGVVLEIAKFKLVEMKNEERRLKNELHAMREALRNCICTGELEVIVIKNVINDDGGTAKPSDFQIGVTTCCHETPHPGMTKTEVFRGSSSGITSKLTGDYYAVQEFKHDGYVTGYSPGCSSTRYSPIASGPSQTITCVIVNDDIEDCVPSFPDDAHKCTVGLQQSAFNSSIIEQQQVGADFAQSPATDQQQRGAAFEQSPPGAQFSQGEQASTGGQFSQGEQLSSSQGQLTETETAPPETQTETAPPETQTETAPPETQTETEGQVTEGQ